MGSKSPHMILMVLPLVCAIIPLAAAVGGALPPAIAQEDASLGEEEDIPGSIVSNVLGGSDNNNNDDDEGNDSNASDEINQETTNTGTTNPNQDRTSDQDEKEVKL